MKALFSLLIGFLLFVACVSKKNENSDNAVLVEYPIPFYLRNSNSSKHYFDGVKTKRFTYVECNGKPWLLFDKYIDREININMINTDEYTFIQIDLKKQLGGLLKNKNHIFLVPYQFVTK